METDIYRAFIEKFDSDYKNHGSAIFPTDGSTATVCLIVGDTAYIVNCGDSACVCIRRGNEVFQATERHNTDNRQELRRIRSNGGTVRRQAL